MKLKVIDNNIIAIPEKDKLNLLYKLIQIIFEKKDEYYFTFVLCDLKLRTFIIFFNI